MVKTELQTTKNAIDSQDEEDPVLYAQRYLNIFHQMHIFNAEQKAKFEDSLLQMPERYRELLPSIPGGRILSEYIENLEVKKGKKPNITKKISENSIIQHQKAESNHFAPEQMQQVVKQETVSLDPDFAKNLAGSLAVAFKNNNLAPGGNLNELSKVISQSFNAYAHNMQQLTTDILSQNMTQLTQAQNYMQEQLTKQNNWQADFQNKITSHIDKRLEQTQQQIQSQMNTQLSWQSKIQEQFEHNLQLQQQSAAAIANASQLNTQNNNANSTTINNLNIDSSSFNNITKAIRDGENQRREYFKKIIDVLNKNFSQNATQKTAELPVLAITNSITQALRENSKQQLEAIKAFGETLSQTIRQSQQELAKTLGKSLSQTSQSNGKVLSFEENTQKSTSENPIEKKNDDTKNKSNEKSIEVKNKNSQPEEKISTKKNKIAKQSISDANNIPQKNSADTNFETLSRDKHADINKDFTLEQLFESEDDSAFVKVRNEKKDIQKKNDISDILTDIVSSEPSIQNTKSKPQQAPKQPELQQAPKKPEPKQKKKPSPQTHLYDDAMQKIKEALQSEEKVSLNDLKDIDAVSLNSSNDEDEKSAFIDTPIDDNFLTDLLSDNSKEVNSDISEDIFTSKDEWEYVDENGNPVEPSGAEEDEWEYVDENGNPVEPSGAEEDEWEYVDENGNPVEPNGAEEDEWEYVDENGNPVEPNGAEEDEWEYVDENGNPVEPNGAEEDEWEYVDEDGNPVEPSDAEEDEREYVDEGNKKNGANNIGEINQISSDDDILAAFSKTDK